MPRFQLSSGNWLIDLSFWAILLLPLLVLPGISFPFGFGRLLVLIGILPVMFLGGLFSKWSAEKRWWRSPLVWIAGCWLMESYIAGILGANWDRSWWGTVNRSNGLLFYTALAIFGAYLLVFIRDISQWQKLIRIICGVGILSALVPILQRVGIDLIPGLPDTERLGGLLGNPIFLGMFLLLTCFFTINLALTTVDKWRWWYICGSLLQIAAIVLTISRGPMIGLVVGIVVMAIGLIWWHAKASRRLTRVIAWGVIAIVGILSVVIFLNQSSLSHLLDFQLASPSTRSRIWNWGVTWQAVKARPAWGYGLENLEIGFNKFYQPGTADIGIKATVVDRAHNLFLDQLGTNGWFGLLLMLSLIIATYSLLIRRLLILRSLADPETSSIGLLIIALLSSIAAYLFASLTAFDTVTSLIYEVFLLALAIWLIAPTHASMISLTKIRWWMLLGLLLGASWLNLRYFLPAWTASKLDVRASRYEKGLNFPQANAIYTQLRKIDSNPYIRYMIGDFPGFAQVYSQDLLMHGKATDAKIIAKNGIDVIKQIAPVFAGNPTILMNGPALYAILSVADPTKYNFTQAQIAFDELIKINPNREYLYFNWSKLLMGTNQPDAAKIMLDKVASFSSQPSELPFWQGVWGVLFKKTPTAETISHFSLAADKKIGFEQKDKAILRSVVGYLVQNKSFQVALYYQIYLAGTSDVAEMINLAIIYSELGLLDKANMIAQKALEIDPSQHDKLSRFLLPQ